MNTSSTPNVQYGYTLMAGGQNNSRLTSLTYPSGYAVNYNYASGLNNTISRLSSISDSTATLESYKYLGLGTVVERDHPQPNVNLTYLKQTGDGNANSDGGDQYTGLDRFGQVIDQFWVNAGIGQAVDRNQYGHDQDGNVLYAANLVDAAFSNLFQYNPLNELTSYQRGTLNSTRTGLVGNPTDSQSWSLDALGNWSSVTTNGTQQTRTHNAENELTTQNGVGLTYDANGNTTQDAVGNKYIYDAWNRLVKVTTSTNTVLASYTYDALGRRITETHGTTTTDLYYSAAWQVLEERVAGVTQARNVWSPAGIDALVLRDQSSQHNGVLDQRLYVLQDPTGNVLALVDSSGNVLERYAYQPFGTFTILDANWNVRGSSAYGWLYFFQGKRYDGAVGLYDFRERVDNPALGRFQQPDPTQYRSGDPNFYRFVGNAPTDAIDPSGTGSLRLPPAPPSTTDPIGQMPLFTLPGDPSFVPPRLGPPPPPAVPPGLPPPAGRPRPVYTDPWTGVYLDPLTGEWTDPRTGGPAWGPFQPRLQLPNGQWIDPAEGFLAAGGPLTPQQYAQWLRMIRPQPGDPGYVEPGLRPDYGTMIAIGSLGAGYLAAGRAVAAPSGIAYSEISTGRTAAINLKEQLAMQEAKAGAGDIIVPASRIGDPRFAGGQWAKFQHVHRAPDGTNYTIHYMKNLQTSQIVDCKFVNP